MTPQTSKAIIAHNDISLAEWALVEEIRAGKWNNLDFPRIAREEFGLNGIEFVNTLFASPTQNYLDQLKANADEFHVQMVLIMVDEEGDGCAPTKSGRKQFAVNHRKWIDVAKYLGCHAIRTNCRGPQNVDREESFEWAMDSYHQLLEYAKPEGISIVIENHGGVSNDPDWMVEFMRRMNDPALGTFPDWRQPAVDFDNFDYLKKTAPFAKGMSYRNQPEEKLTANMIAASVASGYVGWYGIESKGREEVKKGVELLRKYLPALQIAAM